MEYKTKEITLEVGQHGLKAIEKAILHRLTIHERQFERFHSMNVPKSDIQEIKTQMQALAHFRESLVRRMQSNTEQVVLTTSRPEIITKELRKCYVEFSPEDNNEAKKRVMNKPLEEVATLVAGWAHRA